jgi:hypothetical protein
MMQNGGNCAIVKEILPKTSSIWGENVGKFYSTWNPGITYSWYSFQKEAISLSLRRIYGSHSVFEIHH